MEATRNEVATSARQNVEQRINLYNNIIILFAEGRRCICKLMCKLFPTSALWLSEPVRARDSHEGVVGPFHFQSEKHQNLLFCPRKIF